MRGFFQLLQKADAKAFGLLLILGIDTQQIAGLYFELTGTWNPLWYVFGSIVSVVILIQSFSRAWADNTVLWFSWVMFFVHAFYFALTLDEKEVTKWATAWAMQDLRFGVWLILMVPRLLLSGIFAYCSFALSEGIKQDISEDSVTSLKAENEAIAGELTAKEAEILGLREALAREKADREAAEAGQMQLIGDRNRLTSQLEELLSDADEMDEPAPAEGPAPGYEWPEKIRSSNTYYRVMKDGTLLIWRSTRNRGVTETYLHPKRNPDGPYRMVKNGKEVAVYEQ